MPKTMFNEFKYFFFRRNVIFVVIFFVIFVYIFYYIFAIDQNQNSIKIKHYLDDKGVAIEVQKNRLNKLLQVLLINEKNQLKINEKLNVISFSSLIESNLQLKNLNQNNFMKLQAYNNLNKFLVVENGILKVTDEFVRHFQNISNFYSFLKPRNFINKKKINEVISFNFYNKYCFKIFLKIRMIAQCL